MSETKTTTLRSAMGNQQQSREKENNIIHEVQSRRKAVLATKKYGQKQFRH